MENYAEQVQDFAKRHVVALSAVAVTAVGLLAVRRWMAGPSCRSKVRLDGKTVLITGANTGIGRETALDMARRGARVILACRDTTRARLAADDIRQRTGNGNVVVKKLDLASLQSVRELARDVEQSEQRLDVLINNAGIMMCPKWETEDGFEMQFGVNHLGHFLLTNCLLDLLKKSAPSRVVIVSSLAHEKGRIHFDDINLDQKYAPEISYRQSKLANVLFGRELSRQLEGTSVSVYSLHPGVIRTELGRHLLKTLPLWKRATAFVIMKLMKNPTEGAQTSIHCSVEPSLANESGCYYSDCAKKTPAPQGQDDEAAKKLWDVSASMVGLA